MKRLLQITCLCLVSFESSAQIINLDCTFTDLETQKTLVHQVTIDLERETMEAPNLYRDILISPTKIRAERVVDNAGFGPDGSDIWEISRETLEGWRKIDAPNVYYSLSKGTCELVEREVKAQF